MNNAATRLPAAEYSATVQPRFTPTGSKLRPGVVLIMTPALDPSTDGPADHIFYYSSWSFLRERLRVFGFATPEELDTADVRLFTGKQPYLFSSRRWEAPLIDALDLSSHLP